MNKTNSKGFTLVEVIVVAVIVAILAAVAIPIYIGYVNDSAQNVANNEAANFTTAVSAGINVGALNCTFNTTNNTYSWGMPATFTGTPPPTYKVANGVTINTSSNLVATGGTATITIRSKNATARW